MTHPIHRIARHFLLTVAVTLLASASVSARPANKQALSEYFGPFLAVKLNACQTCHLPDKPGEAAEDSDKPHNPFGARLAALRLELRKAGKKADIATRLDLIAEEDSDGDGHS